MNNSYQEPEEAATPAARPQGETSRFIVPSGLTRRTVLLGGTGLAAIVGLGTSLSDLVMPLSAAKAAVPYVQYKYPYSPSTQGDGYGAGRNHSGVDYSPQGGYPNSSLSLGRKIPAIAEGHVSKKGNASDGSILGNRIELVHADGKYTGYCHMRDPSPLEVGTPVGFDDEVGRIGSSGLNNTAYHLHLSMSETYGGAIGGGMTLTEDPLPWIASHLAPAPSGEPVPSLFSRDYSTSQTLATSTTWAGSSLLVAAGTYGIGATEDKQLINASVTVSVGTISTGDWAIARFIRYNVDAGTVSEAFEQVVWSGSTITDSYQIAVNAFVPIGQSLRLQVRSNLSNAHAVDVQTRALVWEL